MAAPKKRVNPIDQIAQRQVPVDTSDPTMDPDMASTLGGEKKRIARNKAMYAPASVTKPKKPGLIDTIKKKMGIQY